MMYNPASTYRLQFHKGFTLKDAEALVEYFSELGVRTIYASPIFAAVPGSTHGYDGINPYEINPEIGDERQLRKLVLSLREKGIGWIQDIVPNHMAYHTANAWVMDVMEKGPLSPYSQVFDSPLSGDFHRGRIMAPFLGDSVANVVEQGELNLKYKDSRIYFQYHDALFPLNSRSYGDILSTQNLPASLSDMVTQLQDLHHISDSVQYTLRWHEMLLQFASLMEDDRTSSAVFAAVQEINASKSRLIELANTQFYRLCSWRETDEHINYRRFFLVNGLICLNVHLDKVFELYHRQIAKFVREGVFQGLRVDHIDGLFDPTNYLHQLRKLCGPACYIVVEKILEHTEELDHSWPIQGSTGYEFLSLVNNLFTRSSAENVLSRFYTSLTGDKESIADKIRGKKQYILAHHMQGELSGLTSYFVDHLLASSDTTVSSSESPAFESAAVREALGVMMIEMNVYRFYGNHFPFEENETQQIQRWMDRCRGQRPELTPFFDYVEGSLRSAAAPQWLVFYQRMMQYTGPLMAKGVEDTLMYTYNRFVGHNEVGDSPAFFGISTSDFHRWMIQRQVRWPLALNTTSTHDTKRGEDVRMRLNVLPDLAQSWIHHVRQWMEMNEKYKTELSPDSNDEYFVYQNLIGIYTFDGNEGLVDRMKQFMIKATREGKRHSDWGAPNERYEQAVIHFVESILSSSSFLNSFESFCRTVADYGMINSLSQVVLKTLCPGVPDVYQGTADWDFSLVDPDNRRSVNFRRQADLLRSDSNFDELWQSRDTGQIKAWILGKMLKLRNTYRDLFSDGQYVPLETEGPRAEHCLAFARQFGSRWIVVAIPLSSARVSTGAVDWSEPWRNATIKIPEHAPQKGKNLFTEEKLQHAGELHIAGLFASAPVAVILLEDEPSDRRAGVLLPLSALPGKYPIGDLGPSARKFADYLHQSRQRVWQLLPVNPVHAAGLYSPYSAYSAMAGAMIYLSPEDLRSEGLLSEDAIAPSGATGRVDYDAAVRYKTALFKVAFDNFCSGTFLKLREEFEQFKIEASGWLSDFSLFEVLRERHGSAWQSWPVELRDRQAGALSDVKKKMCVEIERASWIQFMFHRQWLLLKHYCVVRNISVMGDLPFYLSSDACDIWVNRELFSVDNKGTVLSMAGVPPDYFSADGQMWGMPLYNWTKMKEDNYRWFVDRIRHNLQYFDILRLDHFRAFASYWAISAGESTAINGVWMDGPGKELFTELARVHGRAAELVAEDLGDITPEVYALRDQLELPGMYVLQFAFGDNIASSEHISHNHHQHAVVYTATHDNNTTRGWFRKEADAATRRRLNGYTGRIITAMNVTDMLMKLAYASVANTAIIPMQDILALNERSRLNTPATTGKTNWTWRLTEIPDSEDAASLAKLTRLFGR